jgi:hypothetical protein
VAGGWGCWDEIGRVFAAARTITYAARRIVFMVSVGRALLDSALNNGVLFDFQPTLAVADRSKEVNFGAHR